MPITAVKAATGHMMGAAGTVEAVASVLSLRDGLVPPTIHAEEPDPACDLDLVRDTPRPARLRTVLSNSAGIGGCNAVVIFGAPGEEA
jgi:3-oxoacyl-[acyl-carrier-protein] synthase II